MFHEWAWSKSGENVVCRNCGLKVDPGIFKVDAPEETFRLIFRCHPVQAWNVGQIEDGDGKR